MSEGVRRQPSHQGATRARPAIGKIGRGLPSARCSEQPPPEVLRGFAQFNAGEYFAQHETLEDAWIAETDPVRYLYQGILQVGVGLHHLGRGNRYGAIRLVQKGIAMLEPFRPACLGVDVEQFVQASVRCLAALRELDAGRLSSLDDGLIPKVQLIS